MTTELTMQKNTDHIGIKGLLEKIDVKKRFEEILGENAPAFISSIISLVNSNETLKQCEPNTILAASAIAASLNLPVNQNLGYAYIVPYKNGHTGKYEAQFQIGTKGFVQLAQRTGHYLKINNCIIYEGQLKKRNYLTGDFEFDFDIKHNNTVIGYASYFKLNNGFESIFFMSLDEVTNHAYKYSKSFAVDKKYKSSKSLWTTDFDKSALKTVLKLNLSKWGMLSAQMQKAVEVDQAVIADDDKINYIDSTSDEVFTNKNVEIEPLEIEKQFVLTGNSPKKEKEASEYEKYQEEQKVKLPKSIKQEKSPWSETNIAGEINDPN